MSSLLGLAANYASSSEDESGIEKGESAAASGTLPLCFDEVGKTKAVGASSKAHVSFDALPRAKNSSKKKKKKKKKKKRSNAAPIQSVPPAHQDDNENPVARLLSRFKREQQLGKAESQAKMQVTATSSSFSQPTQREQSKKREASSSLQHQSADASASGSKSKRFKVDLDPREQRRLEREIERGLESGKDVTHLLERANHNVHCLTESEIVSNAKEYKDAIESGNQTSSTASKMRFSRSAKYRHQISTLASQAQAMEEDLELQRARARRGKAKAKAMYGF